MRVARDIAALRAALAGRSPSFVPTMGALHAGHLALMEHARDIQRPLVVSIFVNRSQFAPGEDFDRYPRTPESDEAAAREAGVDVLFVPDEREIYPPDEPLATPPLPAVAVEPRLEDAHRPGHFAGVCAVVARLFDLIRPAIAVFGLKDYQQYLVLHAMVEWMRREEPDRWPGVGIAAFPTQRDLSGLALSSRNARIPPDQHDRALGVVRALQAAADTDDPAAAEAAMRKTLDEHDLLVDYAVVRDARTLLPISAYDRPARALIAARLEGVRLIDNRAV